jgi:hypothetical protein
MKNYEKSIEFLNQLGTKKEFFYSIRLRKPNIISLQGDFTKESMLAFYDMVDFKVIKKYNWMQGETVINDISVKITLVF